jgi:hypothetical protein
MQESDDSHESRAMDQESQTRVDRCHQQIQPDGDVLSSSLRDDQYLDHTIEPRGNPYGRVLKSSGD